MKEVVIWRVWGGEIPRRSLVRKSDHSYTVGSWLPGSSQGTLCVPSTRQRFTYKTYNSWLKSAAKHFIIRNETISW
jgi:hypothetical protein